jgi:hypothetical protein
LGLFLREGAEGIVATSPNDDPRRSPEMPFTAQPNRRCFRTGLALVAAFAVVAGGASSAIAAGPTERIDRNVPPAVERLISAAKPPNAEEKRAIQRQINQGARRAKKAPKPSPKPSKPSKGHYQPLGCMWLDGYTRVCGWDTGFNVSILQHRWNGVYWQEGVGYWPYSAWNCMVSTHYHGYC